jgi:hypothetical protein
MKIRPEHLAHLRRLIQPHDTPERRQRYLAGYFPRSERTKDVDMRYRWDLLWEGGLGDFLSRDLYPYLNDDHIDTALRSFIAPLR